MCLRVSSSVKGLILLLSSNYNHNLSTVPDQGCLE